jgi:hydroxymethylbilane synthase
MPTELPEGLVVAGVLERGEVRDVLVSINRKKLNELDETDIVATSSLRRRAQLLNYNSKLKIVDIRGNVDTRIQKMEDGFCTAMIIAAAGLQRLGLEHRISELLDPAVMTPAVSQGAIAIEIRKNDNETRSLVSVINHQPTYITVMAERVFLSALEGGCQVPIGCFSETDGMKIKMSGVVANTDGSIVMKEAEEGETGSAEKIALNLAQKFLDRGAKELIMKIRFLNNI